MLIHNSYIEKRGSGEDQAKKVSEVSTVEGGVVNLKKNCVQFNMGKKQSPKRKEKKKGRGKED